MEGGIIYLYFIADAIANESIQTCSDSNATYKNGDKVPKTSELISNDSKCSECFCIDGEVQCAALECMPPGKKCVAIGHSDSECCPIAYKCGKIIFSLSNYFNDI